MYLAIFGNNKEEGIYIADWEYWKFVEKGWTPDQVKKFAVERYRLSTGKELPSPSGTERSSRWNSSLCNLPVGLPLLPARRSLEA